ncbi:MAG: ribonuclease P protein component [Verrucomicrobiota bacterium]
MGIPASKRLRKQSDFLKVREEGFRLFCGPFICQARQVTGGEGKGRRLGVIASRRVGNAVKRNRGKRLFRELFRRHEGLIPDGSEMVIVLRANFDQHTFEDLEARFTNACKNITERFTA